LIVLGRVDRVIISGGEKIDPCYVEEVVMKQLAVIGREHRCMVLGFPHPKWGERPVLFVEQGQVEEGTFSDLQEWQIEIESCIREIVDHHLPTLFRPGVIIAVPQFPVNGLGKIAYGELRARYKMLDVAT
jgi:fatty-acyl-CoA synthase